jgi:lysozyme|tara:strand:+ start:13173 stop:13577 length:405 start_codon:yes stop_codon:yes gene_type:complete
VNKLLDRVKEHEGFRSKVYKCTEGYDTIGYGFAIKDLELDEDIAEEILIRKLEKLIKRVRNKFDWLDSVPREVQGVLVEMSYQMGLSGVCKFKNALKYMEHQNWEKAADEMLMSRWYRQTPNRAKELSNIIRNL